MRSFRCLLALAAAAAMASTSGVAVAGPALDRIVSEKLIRIGVRTDAPPFAYLQDGQLFGFSVELCGLVAEAIVTTSKLDDLDAEIVAVQTGERFKALETGAIDVLCGATTATLARREIVSFSIQTFSTGVGAVAAADAPDALKTVLLAGQPAEVSLADLQQALGGEAIGFRANTTAYTWLRDGPLAGVTGLTLTAYGDHAAGIAAVAAGEIAAYVADRAILLGVIRGLDGPERFALSRATFTHEPYALALPRGDEDLRLVIDRALSYVYRTGAILDVYERYFGKPDADVATYYRTIELPE